MSFEAHARAKWTDEVLDFLAWRANALFTDWTPRSMPALAGYLSGQDWETLVIANMLASPRFQADIGELIRLAPREMEQLHSEFVRVSRGRLRGRVLASRTIVERVRQADPTVWVTSKSEKVWQTEPNRLIAGFLAHLMRSAPTVFEHTADMATTPMAAGVRAVERALRTEPLRRVDPDPSWSSRDVAVSLASKSRFYGLASKWMRSFRDARRIRDAETLRQTVLGGWLRAENDDRLFEVYALSRVITLLHGSDSWDKFRLHAGTRTTGEIAVEAVAGPLVVNVRFDRKPPVVGQYSWLLSRYRDVEGRGRRPDLQVATHGKSGTCTTLIEVKATAPNSQYGRDSVVKIFGYLKDFTELWESEDTCQYPRGMLLYPKGVESLVDRATRVESDEVLLSDTDVFDLDLVAVLERHRALALADDGYQ